MLAIAVGPTLTKYMHELLDYMFAGGLTESLQKALVDLSTNIPPLLPTIQERLLNVLSVILFSRPYIHPGAPSRIIAVAPNNKDLLPEIRDNEIIILALKTLGTFDFRGRALHEMVRECAVIYLDDDNPIIRDSAALTTSHLLAQDPACYQVNSINLELHSFVANSLGYFRTTVEYCYSRPRSPYQENCFEFFGSKI